MSMYRDKIFFKNVVTSISEDVRKEKRIYYKLEKHLADVNATMIKSDRFSLQELREINICLKNAVKDIFDHDEEYICSGIPILTELDDDPELFMYYEKGDYKLR